MITRAVFSFAYFFLVSFISLAQNDSDSVNALKQDSALLETQKELNQLDLADSAKALDSLEEAKLLLELENLKAGEGERRQKLKLQIDSIRLATENRNTRIKHQVDSLRESTVGAPVVFDDDTLFFIYSKLGPYSPSERARFIVSKLELMAKEGYNSDKFKMVKGVESSDLFYNEIIVFSITDRDAFWLNQSRQELLEQYRFIIDEKITTYLDENSIIRTTWRIALIFFVIAILFFMVRYLNKGFTRLVIFLSRKGKKYIKGVVIKDYELLTVEREMQIVLFVLNSIKWLIIIFIVYSSLPVIFSIFPATEGVASKLIGYVLNPLKTIILALVGYIPELITIIVIAGVTRYFVKFLRYLAKEVESEKLKIQGFYPDWAKPTFNLLSFLVHAFAFIVIFPYLPGSDSPVFQGVSVFLGLLISLGSSSAIGNMIAGLVITYMRPFKIGERVKIGDTVGDVIEKTMLVTRVRTIKNEDVTIPNAAILNGQTINYTTSSQSLGLILNTTITIGYDVHWKKVTDCMIKAAEATDLVLKEPKPFVLKTSLDDFYISYQINAYTSNPEKAAKIYSELHTNILDVFHDAGIEIMSPHFRAERDGSAVNIPKSNKESTK